MQASEDPVRLQPVAGAVSREQGLSAPMVYRREDYVGAFRHLLIFAVDSSVLFFLLFPLAMIAIPFGELSSQDPTPFLILTWLILCWVYLAVMKPSRFRSVGYWIADARIITIDGKPPSPWRMTMRLMWAAMYLVPYFSVSIFTDLIWTTMNEERQMLRDLMAETRLIRNRAKPIGVGKVSRCLFTGLGITAFYAQVRPKPMTSDMLPPDGVPKSSVTPAVL